MNGRWIVAGAAGVLVTYDDVEHAERDQRILRQAGIHTRLIDTRPPNKCSGEGCGCQTAPRRA